jgi:catechol-2,3-dioxygenase
MAEGIRLSAAVVFVRDLDKSVTFYRELLGLKVTDRSSTAALLVNEDGSQLVLRATGANSPHSLGSIGIQYLAWTTQTLADLDRLADFLRRHSAFTEKRVDSGVTVIEGRDPDDLVIMLMHTDGPRTAMHSLPARIYAW